MPSKLNNLVRQKAISQQGFTLIELAIYLVLLGIVLAGIYNFYFFSSQSSMRSQAESEVLQDARIVMMQMEREIRQANRPRNLTNLPEGVDPEELPIKKGVVIDSGDEMTIYSYINEVPRRITYLIIEDGEYSVMKRSVDDPRVEEPENWEQVLDYIVTSEEQEYFVVNEKKIKIDLSLMDSREMLSRPMGVSNTFTVRGRDVMQ